MAIQREERKEVRSEQDIIQYITDNFPAELNKGLFSFFKSRPNAINDLKNRLLIKPRMSIEDIEASIDAITALFSPKEKRHSISGNLTYFYGQIATRLDELKQVKKQQLACRLLNPFTAIPEQGATRCMKTTDIPNKPNDEKSIQLAQMLGQYASEMSSIKNSKIKGDMSRGVMINGETSLDKDKQKALIAAFLDIPADQLNDKTKIDKQSLLGRIYFAGGQTHYARIEEFVAFLIADEKQELWITSAINSKINYTRSPEGEILLTIRENIIEIKDLSTQFQMTADQSGTQLKTIMKGADTVFADDSFMTYKSQRNTISDPYKSSDTKRATAEQANFSPIACYEATVKLQKIPNTDHYTFVVETIAISSTIPTIIKNIERNYPICTVVKQEKAQENEQENETAPKFGS
jgi:hypothetical protein